MEKRNKLAFWSAQVKYSYVRLLLLYAVVLTGMVGWYLYEACVKFKTEGAKITLSGYLQGMPVYLSFLVLVLGSQVILSVAYARQERDRLAMARLLLEPCTVWRIRFGYSVLVTVAAFLVHFINIFLVFFLDRLMYPECANGVAELYSVFYRFSHLYVLYPVVNPWTALFFALCVVAASQISVTVSCLVRRSTAAGVIYPVGLAFAFFAVTFVSEIVVVLFVGAILVFLVIYTIRKGKRLYIEGEQYDTYGGNGGVEG